MCTLELDLPSKKNETSLSRTEIDFMKQTRITSSTNSSDASDYAIGAVLGQRKDKKPHVIYYASRTLNSTQMNYTTTEKELLAIVFALDKFRSYLIGSPVVCFTDHAALKYLFIKKNAKACLMR